VETLDRTPYDRQTLDEFLRQLRRLRDTPNEVLGQAPDLSAPDFVAKHYAVTPLIRWIEWLLETMESPTGALLELVGRLHKLNERRDERVRALRDQAGNAETADVETAGAEQGTEGRTVSAERQMTLLGFWFQWAIDWLKWYRLHCIPPAVRAQGGREVLEQVLPGWRRWVRYRSCLAGMPIPEQILSAVASQDALYNVAVVRLFEPIDFHSLTTDERDEWLAIRGLRPLRSEPGSGRYDTQEQRKSLGLAWWQLVQSDLGTRRQSLRSNLPGSLARIWDLAAMEESKADDEPADDIRYMLGGASPEGSGLRLISVCAFSGPLSARPALPGDTIISPHYGPLTVQRTDILYLGSNGAWNYNV
jgi:hypothetical protein